MIRRFPETASASVPWMTDVLARLKCMRSIVMDGELVA
jgi:hypothetical protein